MSFVRAPDESPNVILTTDPLGVTIAKDNVGPLGTMIVAGVRKIAIGPGGVRGGIIIRIIQNPNI